MSELILRCDDGPDFKVDSDNKAGHAEIVCGRTSKIVGRVTIYKAAKNLLVYVTDKRRKEGQNRVAYLLDRSSTGSDILAKCGGGYAMKEALRMAGYVDEGVLVSAADAVIE